MKTKFLLFIPSLLMLIASCNTNRNTDRHSLEIVKEFSSLADSCNTSNFIPVVAKKLKQLRYQYLSALSDSQFISVSKHICNKKSCSGEIDTLITLKFTITALNENKDTFECYLDITSDSSITSFTIKGKPDPISVWQYESEKIKDKKLISKLDSLGRYYASTLGWHTYEKDFIVRKYDGYFISYVFLSNDYLKDNIVYDPYINLYLNSKFELQNIGFFR